MGVKRYLKHVLIPGSRTIDTIMNIQSEGGIKEGAMKSLQDEIEDMKSIMPGYKMGVFDGKKEGYNEASIEYEKKLMEQADLFLNQEKDYRKEKEEYNKLLDEYEEEIRKLSEKVNKTEAENRVLQELLDKEEKLRLLAA